MITASGIGEEEKRGAVSDEKKARVTGTYLVSFECDLDAHLPTHRLIIEWAQSVNAGVSNVIGNGSKVRGESMSAISNSPGYTETRGAREERTHLYH